MTSPRTSPDSPVAAPRPATAANRFGLDYRREAGLMPPPPAPIVDAHLHISGAKAAAILRRAADLFGVQRFYSQTRLADVEAVRSVMGGRVRFVAGPNWSDPDRGHAFREGFLETMRTWRDTHGSRIVKFWCAPRLWELVGACPGDPRDCVPIDSPWRIRAAEQAQGLGMMFMAHVADPDTWFATKYSDAARFGSKRSQYEGLERMLERFTNPWILAHMGGSPEDLGLLDGLLERHANLYLDTSATKWIVRELSRHPRERLREFMTRWAGRVLFGSDIVTMDEHLHRKDPDAPPSPVASPMASLADGEDAAFDLYASRYYTLRTFWETEYEGESPIADPDLAMVDPRRYDQQSAPVIRGVGLDAPSLRTLYSAAAAALVDRWHEEH